ncbi:nucleoside-diphosphate kinase [Candidatus Micrarchaeota archaeon]|nr:nucleoside-diphosphate kinase [Candidatus Micrarchaeota archaeon]
MEKTFVLAKPDAVQRGLVGEIVKRLESKGLKLVAAKMIKLEDKILDEHYAHLKDKPFFPATKKFMQTTPAVAMVWEGKEAVEVVRTLCGVTNSRKAAPGTIRGDWGQSIQANLVHASDSLETAEKEIRRFFKKEEIFPYALKKEEFIYSPDERE